MRQLITPGIQLSHGGVAANLAASRRVASNDVITWLPVSEMSSDVTRDIILLLCNSRSSLLQLCLNMGANYNVNNYLVPCVETECINRKNIKRFHSEMTKEIKPLSLCHCAVNIVTTTVDKFNVTAAFYSYNMYLICSHFVIACWLALDLAALK